MDPFILAQIACALTVWLSMVLLRRGEAADKRKAGAASQHADEGELAAQLSAEDRQWLIQHGATWLTDYSGAEWRAKR